MRGRGSLNPARRLLQLDVRDKRPDHELYLVAAGRLICGKLCRLIDHANALICSEPTTLADAVALMRYVANLDEWQEPVDRRDWDTDDTVRKWHQVFLNTMARSLEKISAVCSEPDPRHMLVDLFEEELLPDPAAMADAVIQHLRDSGFEITPIDYPKRGAS